MNSKVLSCLATRRLINDYCVRTELCKCSDLIY